MSTQENSGYLFALYCLQCLWVAIFPYFMTAQTDYVFYSCDEMRLTCSYSLFMLLVRNLPIHCYIDNFFRIWLLPYGPLSAKIKFAIGPLHGSSASRQVPDAVHIVRMILHTDCSIASLMFILLSWKALPLTVDFSRKVKWYDVKKALMAQLSLIMATFE